MINSYHKSLVISPHPDDGILGCGSTISRLAESNTEVHYIIFSTTDFETSGAHNSGEILSILKMSLIELGLLPERISLYNFNTRNFYKSRQEILEILIGLRDHIHPQQIFMPSSSSIHQDHRVIYEEGLRAFKHTSCYGYDLPWDAANFETSCFFKVGKTHIEQKKKALQILNQYNTNKYANARFTEGLAYVRGTQINVPLAEAFEAIRTVI
jgi:LmbE family N-acetylglucosaminyl deacetylase